MYASLIEAKGREYLSENLKKVFLKIRHAGTPKRSKPVRIVPQNLARGGFFSGAPRRTHPRKDPTRTVWGPAGHYCTEVMLAITGAIG